MSADLWISVALAIPLAIAANIVTPKVQRWLDSRAERSKGRKAATETERRRQQLAQLERELAEVERISTDKANLTHHYLDALIKVAFYSAFGTIYGALFTFVGEVGRWDGALGVLARIGAQSMALLVSMLIFLTCMKVIRIARRVRDIESYREKTQKLIQELRGDV